MFKRSVDLGALLLTLVTLHGCDCGGGPPATGDGGDGADRGGHADGGRVDSGSGDGGGGDGGGVIDAAGGDGGGRIDAAGGDGGGGIDGSDATVGNQPPAVPAVEAVALYPGDSADLLEGAISDPDGDPLSCAWSASEVIAGAALPTGCEDPRLAIDRAQYEGGPTERQLTLTLEVSDGTQAVQRPIAVTILDERGGDVANTSSWEGTGYQEGGSRHGCCGAPGRACATIEDAMANLRGRIVDGAGAAPLVRLATTGVDYLRDDALLLDDDAGQSGVSLSLECGFDPVSWDKPSGTWTHTPIRFSGAAGINILASGVRLEGCDVQGAEPAQVPPQRFAVQVQNAAVEIRDNILVASPETLQSAPGEAYGLVMLIDDEQSELQSVVADNSISGGLVTTTAFGVYSINGAPRIEGNAIRGGRGVAAVGLYIKAVDGTPAHAEVTHNTLIEGGAASIEGYGLLLFGGNVWVHDNLEIAGCRQACTGESYTGIRVSTLATLFSTPMFERNAVHGVVDQVAPLIAVALELGGDATSRDSSYRGGRAAISRGAYVGAVFRSSGDSFEGGEAFDADPADPADGRALGMELAEGATAELFDCSVRGASEAAATTPWAGGVQVNGEAWLDVTGGAIDSGPAQGIAVGLYASGPLTHLLVNGTAISGGDTAGGAGSLSVGLSHDTGNLQAYDVQVRAGRAQVSVGLLFRDDAGRRVERGLVQGGDCTVADGSSRGIMMQGESNQTTLLDLQLHSGDGCQTSYGVHLTGAMQRFTLGSCDVAGGAASVQSAGLYAEGLCRNCAIDRSTLTGGGSIAAGTLRAVGLRVRATGGEVLFDNGVFIMNSRISGGEALISHGLELAGDTDDDLVVLHNIIDGGGAAGLADSLSAAVFLSGDAGVANAHAGLFVGNIIRAGTAQSSYGYWEGCSSTGGLHRAEPYRSLNNAFWPAIDGSGVEPAGYVRKAPPDDCANAFNLTTIEQVNLAAYYGSGAANRASIDVFPLLEADGLHLQPGSPLRDQSLSTGSYWSQTADALLDVDGEERPCGDNHDIGVDEVCP